MSWAPPRALVPSLKTVNESPPVARKLFMVTRKLSLGWTSTPLTHIRPMVAGQLVLAAAGFASYFNVEEICRMRLPADGFGLHGAYCCWSSRRIMSPVIVLVTRLLPNGCTVNASP